jgi:hypothetical protein
MKVIYVVSVKGENVRAFKKEDDADHMAEILQGYVDEVEVGF